MTKINFVIVFTFLVFNYNSVAQKTISAPIQVVLLAGQSNMAGHGDYDKLSDDVKQRIKKVSNRVFLSTNPKKEPFPLSYYTTNIKKYNFNNHFGPELFIGLTLAEAHPEKEFLLIKKAVGGTSLYGAWNPDWSAEKSNIAERGEQRKKLKLFDAHINNIKRNLKALKSKGRGYEVIGLAWMQGEGDTNKKITATNYKVNIINLISGYRTELGLPNLPVVLGQINILPRKFNEGPKLVRQAVEEVSKEDINVAIIKTSTDRSWSDYPKHSDNVHYNTEGQKRLGIAFAEKLIKLQTN